MRAVEKEEIPVQGSSTSKGMGMQNCVACCETGECAVGLDWKGHKGVRRRRGGHH